MYLTEELAIGSVEESDCCFGGVGFDQSCSFVWRLGMSWVFLVSVWYSELEVIRVLLVYGMYSFWSKYTAL